MITACWSLKGGAGTTVVAAGLALALAQRRGFARSRDHGASADPRPVVLVDLAGDLPAALGLPDASGPGVAEWIQAGPSAPPDALARIETQVRPGLALLHRGHGDLATGRDRLLLQVLALSGSHVVIDCGTIEPHGPATFARDVAAGAERSLLVTRPCYLALRRSTNAQLCANGVVVLREPGRCLSDDDIARFLGIPVVASIAVDPAVSRAVDTGLLVARLPRTFNEVMRRVS